MTNAELYRKKCILAKDDYGVYLTLVNPAYEHNRLTKLLCSKVDEVVKYDKQIHNISNEVAELKLNPTDNAREISKRMREQNLEPKRIILNVPPQHGKSESITRHMPGYYLMHYPDKSIITASYGSTFAKNEFGLPNMTDVTTVGEDVFGHKLSRLRRAKDEFGLDGYSGKCTFRSLEGSIVGISADLMIIDDPVSSSREVATQKMRDNTWNAWQGTINTRISPTASIIIIMTRWHEDDLAGRIIRTNQEKKMNGDDYIDWEVINIPLICDDEKTDALGRELGETIVPIRHGLPFKDVAWANKEKATQGARVFQCMYQGDPLPTEDMQEFKNSYFQFYDTLPVNGDYWISWDFNFKSENTSSDYIVGQVWKECNDIHYLVHQLRGHWKITEVIEKMVDLYGTYKPKGTLIEAKANGDAIINLLDKRIPNIVPINPKDSKYSRSKSIISDFELGKVRLPKNVNWITGYIDEFKKFPYGANDDQIDATTQYLIHMKDNISRTPTYTKGNVFNLLMKR